MSAEPQHGSLADAVAALEAECAALADREARWRRISMSLYRRGYLAGRYSIRSGAPEASEPERNARGELRRLLREGER
jgi:hypothetical protein